MSTALKRYQVIAVLGVVLAAISFYLGSDAITKPEPVTTHDKAFMLGGVLLFIVTAALTVIFFMDERLDSTDEFIKRTAINLQELKAEDTKLKNVLGNVLTLVKTKEHILADPWFGQTISEIGSNIEQMHSDRVHARPFFEDIVTGALRHAAGTCVRSIYRQEYSENYESERMRRISDAVGMSRQYVEAVTFDIEKYFCTFWDPDSPHFGGYLRLNEAAASRAVSIRRTFVMGMDAINGIDNYKHERLYHIVKAHQEFANKDCITRVICIADIDLNLPIPLRSFFTCDNILASESYCREGGKVEPGYVVIGDVDLVRKLSARYLALQNLTDHSATVLRNKPVKNARGRSGPAAQV